MSIEFKGHYADMSIFNQRKRKNPKFTYTMNIVIDKKNYNLKYIDFFFQYFSNISFYTK